jgi:radical SAM protein with 4Fe4S-binding SPASM domain
MIENISKHWKDSLNKRRDSTFKLDQKNYSEDAQFPRELILDINNRCNHKCYFCANPKIEKYDALNFELALKLMKEAKSLGATDLGLQATGEPFMDKRLADFIVEGKKMGYEYIYINTNGALASPKKSKPVIDAGCDSIKFSINAHNKEDFKTVHGYDDFEKVISNLKWIFNYRNETKAKMGVYVSSVRSSKTKMDESNIETTITEHCDNFDIRDVSNQGGSMMELNDTEEIYEGNILGSLKKEEYTSRCVYPFNRIVINPYGFVVACTADFHNMLEIADANKNKLIDIWNSNEFKYLRRKHLKHDYVGLFCDKCLNNKNCKPEKLVKAFQQNL